MTCTEIVNDFAEKYRHYVAQSYSDDGKALERSNEFHRMIGYALKDEIMGPCLIRTKDKRILKIFNNMYTIEEKERLFGPSWREHLRS